MTCTREGVKPAIPAVRAEGFGRRGERLFDGKAALHAGEPRCVRSARATSTHLHAKHEAARAPVGPDCQWQTGSASLSRVSGDYAGLHGAAGGTVI